MNLAWNRLIRFVATDGRILRGDPILPSPDFDLGDTTEDSKLQARVIIGADIYDDTGITRVSDEVVTVKRLLGPLTAADVDILRCVGLNYAKHSKLMILCCALRSLKISSQGSWPDATSISFHFFQTEHVHSRA